MLDVRLQFDRNKPVPAQMRILEGQDGEDVLLVEFEEGHVQVFLTPGQTEQLAGGLQKGLQAYYQMKVEKQKAQDQQVIQDVAQMQGGPAALSPNGHLRAVPPPDHQE